MSLSQPVGLSAAEVAERVARGETNAYKPHVEHTYWQIVRDNVFNLFNVVLFILLVIVAFFHDYDDIFFAGFSVAANALIGTIQEISAKRSLDRLAALAAHDVRAWRAGRLTTVPIAQIVKDDVLPIEPGDRLVVDGRVLDSDGLEMDESLLTGESDAVQKEVGDTVCSGSFCIAGVGVMIATQVGENSTINRLARTAKAFRSVKTPTQRKVNALVEISVGVMLLLGPMIFVMGYVNHLTLLETVKNAVVLVTSLVPQGLVLVTTLSLTLGAIRISRQQTLVQRINAVESLANTTVLCFDKTGTLTRNELAVTDVIPLNGQGGDQIRTELAMYTANLAHLNKTAAAVAAYAGKPVNGATKQQEIPFTSARKWGALVFDDHTYILGAPERILRGEENHAGLGRAEQLSTEGQRVLAFAHSTHPPLNDRLDETCEPLALIVMSDQIRDDIQETLASFYKQQIELKVISGDNVETVCAIASKAGVHVTSACTGNELEAMSEAELANTVRSSTVFARIEPDTKRKIIAALKQQGSYVAMVGDGVNDVPALKEAHLAIAMNGGAQIAKDVSDMVLLNNAMSTLPLAFEEGKVITQKIYGTAKMYLTKNVYSILLFVFVGFMMLPFPINPVQISWVVFGTINIPATLIAFGLLRPAPLRYFARDVLDYVISSGIIGAAAMAALYVLVHLVTGRNNAVSRSTLTVFMVLFGVLVFWNTHHVDLFQPRTLLTYLPMTVLGLVLGAVTILLPYLMPATFRFVAPTGQVWLLIIGVFAIAAVALNLVLHNRHITGSLWQLARDEGIQQAPHE